jgi:hypothetical protein
MRTVAVTGMALALLLAACHKGFGRIGTLPATTGHEHCGNNLGIRVFFFGTRARKLPGLVCPFFHSYCEAIESSASFAWSLLSGLNFFS